MPKGTHGWPVMPPFMVLLLGASPISPCGGVAIVQATEPLKSHLSQALEAAGIKLVSESADCIPVRATAIEQSGQIEIEIEGPSGQTSSRNVSSIAMAAVLIESWSKVEPSLLDIPVLDEPPRAPPALETQTLSRATVSKPLSPRIRLAAAAELTMGDDGSLLYGSNLSACIRFDWLCLDVLARFGAGQGSTSDSYAPTDRFMAEAAVGASVPIEFDSMFLVPGVMFGLAWLRTTLAGFDEIECPPDDPCLIGADVVDPGAIDQWRPRTHLTLTAGLPLSEAVSIAMTVGATWSAIAGVKKIDRGPLFPGNQDELNLVEEVRDPTWSFFTGAEVLVTLW